MFEQELSTYWKTALNTGRAHDRGQGRDLPLRQ
jgi:hypothetical protein